MSVITSIGSNFMVIVASILIVLGVVSIYLGFGPMLPDASICGAIFFIGGWVLIGLDRVTWHLERLRQILADKTEQE